MSGKYVHENGLPFYDSLREYVLDDIYNTPRIPKCILVDGIPYTGKTTLAVEIGDYFEGRPLTLERDDHPQIAMGGLKLIDQAIECSEKGHKVIIYDEAGDFSKTGAMTRFNKLLYEFFTKFRAFNIVVIICVQRFWHIDKRIFELGVIQALIHCYDARPTYSRYGVYDVEGIGWLRTYVEKFKNNPQNAYRRQQPYIRGIFLDLPPERSEKLSKLSLTDKKKTMKKSVKRFKDNP